MAHVGDGGEKVCNDSGTSKGHLSSGQDVAHKGGYYYEKEEDNTYVSCFLIQVGAVVQASSNVEVNADEEERRAVSVYVPD